MVVRAIAVLGLLVLMAAAPVTPAPFWLAIAPKGAMHADGWTERDAAERWFSMPQPLPSAYVLVKRRFLALGWQICPPIKKVGFHDEIRSVGGAHDRRRPRLADRAVSVTRRRWSGNAALYRLGSGTYVDFRTSNRFGNLCGSAVK